MNPREILNILALSPNATGIYSGHDIVIEAANDAMLSIWSKDRSIIGKPMADALPELQDQPFLGILKEVMVTGITYRATDTKAMLMRNGALEAFYFDFVYEAVITEGGETYILHTATDVTRHHQSTEQVAARKAVEERELHFKHLADLVPAKISNALPTGEVTFFNRHWLDFSGLSFEDTRDFGYHQMMHPDEIAPFQAGLYEAAMQGKPYISEMRFKNMDGNYIWHINIASPILDENGAITMWVGSTTDIQRLKEEEQRKSDFVAMLSHELKTPITSIKGYIQLFMSMLGGEGDARSPAMFKPSLERVDKLVTRLTSLVDEMLSLGKIESGKLTIDKQPIDLNELVKTIVQDFRLTNKDYNISLQSKKQFRVNADADKIGQVLINFISNAIKYAPNSQRIDVSIYDAGNNNVAVSVQDYGNGIDTAEHKKIFGRFYRVEGKIEQQVSGFGIGLFIAQSVIEAHDGQIILESAKGKGSTFTFIIPLA